MPVNATAAPPRASARRGSNLPRVGDYNQVVVLEAIRRSTDGLSRVEVAAATGLSPQAVSNICRRLLQTGLVEEAGKKVAGPGKPRTLLRLAPNGRFAVGVHLDPALTTFVVLDLVGRPVARSVRPLRPGLGPDQVLREVAEEVAALIASSGVDPERVVGLGVAAPGPVDTATGSLVRPPNLLGWDRVAIRDVLGEATGLSVLLDKDVVAAAVAELWTGAVGGTDSAVFFYIGTGVGAGLVLRGEVHRGTSGNAGEMGHLVTGSDGPPCACGQRGCVGEVCSPRTVVETAHLRGIGPLDPPEGLGGDDPDHRDVVGARFRRLCALAEDGHPGAQELLDDMARRFAKSAGDVVNLLDVDQVVFGGPLWEHLAPTFLRIVPKVLRGSVVTAPLHATTVRGTSLGADVAALGAASLVLDEAFSPRSATLLVAH